MAQTKIDVAKLQFDDEGVDTEVRLSLSLLHKFSKTFVIVDVNAK